MSIKMVVIQATPFCNINCDYCYLANRADPAKMKPNLLETIIKKILASELIDEQCEILWHAGEPLAAGINFFENAINFIRKYNVNEKNISHNIQTNALLLNDKWCEFFKKNIFKIGVSIDGPAFIHDRFRKTRNGKGTFSSVMNGIKLLIKHEINFGALLVLTHESLNYPHEIFNFFLDEGFNWVGFNLETTLASNSKSSLIGNPNVQSEIFAKYKTFLSVFFDLWLKSKEKITIREFKNICDIFHNKQKDRSYQYSSIETKELEIITINKNGDISPHCPELAEGYTNNANAFVIGNIEEINSLNDILRSNKRQKIYADILAGIKNCQTACPYFDFCGGGSPSVKFYETASFSSTETKACVLSKKITMDVILHKLVGHSILD